MYLGTVTCSPESKHKHTGNILRHSQGGLCSKKTLNKLAHSDPEDAAGPSIWLPALELNRQRREKGGEQERMSERKRKRDGWRQKGVLDSRAQCVHLDKAPPHYSTLIRPGPDTLIKYPCCLNTPPAFCNFLFSLITPLPALWIIFTASRRSFKYFLGLREVLERL